MTYIRDEVLVAYADGQLRCEERLAVERLLAIDEQARHSVALFKLTRHYVQQVFAEIDFSGVPTRLGSLLSVKAPGFSVRPRWRGSRLNSIATFIPLAACICFAVGFGAAQLPGADQRHLQAGATALGLVDPNSYLADAIQHARNSGADWAAPNGLRFVDIADFKDKFGQECREFEVFSAGLVQIPAELLIVCQNRAGRWSVVSAVSTVAAGTAVQAQYVPSESEARTALQSVFNMLGAQQRTSAAERKHLTP